MKPSHIYLFSSYNTLGVSTRYRGTYVLDEIERRYGLKYTFVFPGYRPKEILNFIIAYFSVLIFRKKNSLVIFQKLHSVGVYTFSLRALLRLRHKNTIYDTDDADYLRFNANIIHHFMRNCTLCTVGSQALFDYTKKRNKNILLLTSPVIWHNEIKTKRNKTLHIGWVGDFGMNTGTIAPYSHKISLIEILFPGLKELKFEFKLTLLGLKNPNDKYEVENYFAQNKNIILNIPMNINWLDEIGLYKTIKSFDIGVSPMVNHEFNVAKSAFKAKQYLSCGVPVLASPIGENNMIIKDGFNGYICNTREDFKSRILEISSMPDFYYGNLCKNARESTPSFRIDQYCKNLIDHFNNAL